MRDEVPGDLAYLDAYAAGLRAYREGRWEEAERMLHEVVALREEGDGPSRTLLGRIEDLKKDAPNDWDGTWTFGQK